MNIGGLSTSVALLKNQMKKKPCKRCGFHYDPREEEKCPHCDDLDDRGLAQLLEKKESRFQSNRSLGVWFVLGAIVILILMVLGLIY